MASPVRVGVLVVLACALGACAARMIGLVHPTDGSRVEIETPQGDRFALGLPGEAAPMRWLDGHLVEVEGARLFRRVRVASWRVLEGRHGLPVWVGPIERRGAQLTMRDRGSGAVVFLDERAVPVLWDHEGQVVLVEGYVEGAHRIRVVYFRVLAPPED